MPIASPALVVPLVARMRSANQSPIGSVISHGLDNGFYSPGHKIGKKLEVAAVATHTNTYLATAWSTVMSKM